MTLTLGEIAEAFDLELRGDASITISGLANLADAGPGQLAFLFSSRFRGALSETNAAAIVLRAEDAPGCELPLLIAERPRLALANIAARFDPAPLPSQKIHEAATISPTASVGSEVSIGAGAVIEAAARIDKGAVIGAGCYIGEHSHIGENTRLAANVSIYHGVSIGAHGILHSGVVIGADGFGFEPDPEAGRLVKVPQIYGVRIGEHVEIGAGTTIDRGALNDTVIGDGVKLDNQVQIGHGTSVGANTVISGCTAIAGSTRVGRHCLIGGAVGIVDNIEIVDGVEITAMTLVSRSITTPGRYSSGTGMMPGGLWKRNIVGFARLDEILKRLRRVETSIKP